MYSTVLDLVCETIPKTFSKKVVGTGAYGSQSSSNPRSKGRLYKVLAIGLYLLHFYSKF